MERKLKRRNPSRNSASTAVATSFATISSAITFASDSSIDGEIWDVPKKPPAKKHKPAPAAAAPPSASPSASASFHWEIHDSKPAAKRSATVRQQGRKGKAAATKKKVPKRLYPSNRNVIRKEAQQFRHLLGRRPFLTRTLTPLWDRKVVVTKDGDPAQSQPIPTPTIAISVVNVYESDGDGTDRGNGTSQGPQHSTKGISNASPSRDPSGSPNGNHKTTFWNTSAYVTKQPRCPLCSMNCKNVPSLIRHVKSHSQHPYFVCDVLQMQHGTGRLYGNVYHLSIRPIDISLSEVIYANYTFVRHDHVANRNRAQKRKSRQWRGGKRRKTKPPIKIAAPPKQRQVAPVRLVPLTLDRKECLAPPPSMVPKHSPQPIRKYYHRRSNQVKQYVTFEDDSTDDDSDQEPMDALCNGMLSEFEDIPDVERRFFRLWGTFMRRQQRPFPMREMLLDKTVQFVHENHKQLVGLRWLFLKHLQNMCLITFGFTGDQLLHCMRIFDRIVAEG